MNYLLAYVLAVTGITAIFVGIKLYAIFTYEERYDAVSGFSMTWKHIVTEEDQTFIVCPRCSTSYDWYELLARYPHMSSVDLDQAVYSDIGLLCPDCAQSWKEHCDVDCSDMFDDKVTFNMETVWWNHW